MQLEAIVAKEIATIIKEQFAANAEQIEALKTRVAILEARKPEKGERGEKGEPGQAGQNGKDGRDGIDGKDGAGPSRGRHRGPWKHDEQYYLDDSVMDKGSVWIAMTETPQGRPSESRDWQMVLRKPRDGKDGERGPPGPPGPPGKDFA